LVDRHTWRIGGLESWQEEVIGRGRQKTGRYHYRHALKRQMDLGLDATAVPERQAG